MSAEKRPRGFGTNDLLSSRRFGGGWLAAGESVAGG